MDILLTSEIYVALLIAYGVGSIPFGLVLSKLKGYGDIRNIGSGNIGATNVLRTGDKKLAALVLALDIAKGYVGYYVGSILGTDIALLCAFISIVAHVYPVWLNFKGGKGVATSLGTLLAINPVFGIAIAGLWVVTSKVTKISSVSALFAFALCPFIATRFGGDDLLLYTLLVAALIFWRHKENIKRLAQGTEPKIGEQ